MNKIAIITGSSSGIGAETAKLFSEKGYSVAVTYHKNKKGGEKVLAECSNDSALFQLDVTSSESIRKFVKEVTSKFKKLDILINNAGVVRWKKFKELDFKDIEQLVEVNYTGLVKVTKAFFPHLLKQKKATIINIASVAGKTGFEDLTVYCGTKFAVRGFTQALAEELPSGLKVFSVNPGLTATRMTDFQGVDPTKVAKIILHTAEEKLKKKSGEDVDVPDYL